MERLTLKVLILLFPFLAHAGGSISLEPSYDPERDRTHVSIGLGVYQLIKKDMAYSSWTGFGDSYDQATTYHAWYITKHQLDLKVSDRVTFSPGLKLNYLDDQENDYKKRLFGEVFGKISVKLW